MKMVFSHYPSINPPAKLTTLGGTIRAATAAVFAVALVLGSLQGAQARPPLEDQSTALGPLEADAMKRFEAIEKQIGVCQEDPKCFGDGEGKQIIALRNAQYRLWGELYFYARFDPNIYGYANAVDDNALPWHGDRAIQIPKWNEGYGKVYIILKKLHLIHETEYTTKFDWQTFGGWGQTEIGFDKAVSDYRKAVDPHYGLPNPPRTPPARNLNTPSDITGIRSETKLGSGGTSQKLVGNVFHNDVIPAGSSSGTSPRTSPSVSSLGSDNVRSGEVSFVMPSETKTAALPRPVNRTGASGPQVANLPAPTVDAPQPRMDPASYQKTVMDRLKAMDAKTFGDPRGDGTRYASIIIPDAYKSDEPPDAAAEHIKKVVDDFLRKRKETADARKKAAQPVVRRPTLTPAQPEVAGDNSVDYSEAASTLLGIAGALAPMVGSVRVPTVRAPAPSIRAPGAAVRTPVVRPPTSQSDITGLGR